MKTTRRAVAITSAGVIAAAALVLTWMALSPRTSEVAAAPVSTASPTQTPTPTPTSLTESQALLASSDDPAACAVSFEVDGAAFAPMLQTQGALFSGLPIPDQPDLVFAGWYATPADAAAFSVPARVNGSELVLCTEQEITLHGSWKSADENVAENARIPIMMYHQFTSLPDGEDHWLRGNYAYVGDFDAHMSYIASGGFYLPTWDELAAFIDGRLFLPTRSVVITDDDADQTWFDLGAPVIEKYQLLTTSFMVTAYRQDPPPNPSVLRRSHTHDMHQAGANGEGRMVNWTADEIAADLETSAEILGVKEVVAYPFGHYNDTTKQGVAQAGFEMGRTIEQGYVSIGTDKLALPVVRINYGMGLNEIINLIG